MFCKKCGAKLPEESSFCQKCGQKVSSAEKNPDAPKKEKKSFEFKRYMPFVRCLVWLLLLTLFLLLVFLLLGITTSIPAIVLGGLSLVSFISYWFYKFTREKQPTRKEVWQIVMGLAIVSTIPLVILFGVFSRLAFVSFGDFVFGVGIAFVLLFFAFFWIYGISAIAALLLNKLKPNLSAKMFAASFIIFFLLTIGIGIVFRPEADLYSQPATENDLEIKSFSWEEVGYSEQSLSGTIFAKPRIILTLFTKKYMAFKATIDNKLVNYYSWGDPNASPGPEEGGWQTVFNEPGERIVEAGLMPIRLAATELKVCFKGIYEQNAQEFCKTKVIEPPRLGLQLSEEVLNFSFQKKDKKDYSAFGTDMQSKTITLTNNAEYIIHLNMVGKNNTAGAGIGDNTDCYSMTLQPGESKICTFFVTVAQYETHSGAYDDTRFIIGPYKEPNSSYPFTKEISVKTTVS